MEEGAEGAVALLRDPAFLQVALNVLLFVPLGVLVRLILKRGVVVATALGLAVSLLIETTQLTGVWHLYDCAYRLFDVDDLVVNTLGALVGSRLLGALHLSAAAARAWCCRPPSVADAASWACSATCCSS